MEVLGRCCHGAKVDEESSSHAGPHLFAVILSRAHISYPRTLVRHGHDELDIPLKLCTITASGRPTGIPVTSRAPSPLMPPTRLRSATCQYQPFTADAHPTQAMCAVSECCRLAILIQQHRSLVRLCTCRASAWTRRSRCAPPFRDGFPVARCCHCAEVLSSTVPDLRPQSLHTLSILTYALALDATRCP
jgi:hypothetical protein